MKSAMAALCVVGMLAVVGCGGDDDDNKGGGTGTAAEACKSFVTELCSKFFGCYSDEELDAAAALIGNNEADCRTKLEQSTCSEQMIKCDSGKSFSSSKASECLSQYKQLSCNEVNDGAEPAACDEVCQ
jgi:hypothetical protein